MSSCMNLTLKRNLCTWKSIYRMFFSDIEMNYEMLAEIDDEIGDLHILDTANTVRVYYIKIHIYMRNESYQFHLPCAYACP